MENVKLFKQGAEGRIFTGTYLGQPTIAKERFQKEYRHPDLDSSLTKERMKRESRALIKCKCAGIRTPTIYLVDFKRRTIFMQYLVYSITVKNFIESALEYDVEAISVQIGEVLGKMHTNNIIHGDLTTSNMLLVNKNDELSFNKIENLEIVFIDFGLAHVDGSDEDKGVDLYVLERALVSTHPLAKEIFKKILVGYKKLNKSGFKSVQVKYEEVRARGRKRTMVG